MNYWCHELSLALADVRDLENTLAHTFDFERRFAFTSSHGQATALDRALDFDIQHARVLVRALSNALADVNDLALDRIGDLIIDLDKTLNSVLLSSLALECGGNSLERARGLVSAIDGTLAALKDRAFVPNADRGDASTQHGRFAEGKSFKSVNPPPVFAEHLLKALAGRDEAIVGDFLERHQRQFDKTLTKRVGRLAQLDYWWQVLRSIPGLVRIRLRM